MHNTPGDETGPRSNPVSNGCPIEDFRWPGEVYSPVPQEPPAPTGTKLRTPVLAPLLMLSIWLVFWYGIFVEIGFKQSRVGWHGPVSPRNPALMFLTVGFYPQCNDDRPDVWRLFTVQFVHAGLQHLCGNTVLGLIVGCMLEMFAGSLLTLLVFEAAVVLGTLSHSYFLPYNGLVGCSHGVYGWVGALLAFSLLNVRRRSAVQLPSLFLLLVLLVMLASDFYNFLTSYQTATAYGAHIGGFLTGLLLCGSLTAAGSSAEVAATEQIDDDKEETRVTEIACFGKSRRCDMWVLFAAVTGLLLLALSVLLCVHYSRPFPPVPPPVDPGVHPDQQASCCIDLFALQTQFPNMSTVYVQENYYCNIDYKLVPRWHNKL